MFGLRTWTMWTETLSSTRLDTKESLCHCSGRCWEVHLHRTIDVTMSMIHVPSSLLLLRMLRPTFYSQKFASTMRFHVTATEMFFVYKHGLLCHSFIAARALATYLIPGCVGRGVRLGSENSSGAGGVWKSGGHFSEKKKGACGNVPTSSGLPEIWGPSLQLSGHLCQRSFFPQPGLLVGFLQFRKDIG